MNEKSQLLSASAIIIASIISGVFLLKTSGFFNKSEWEGKWEMNEQWIDKKVKYEAYLKLKNDVIIAHYINLNNESVVLEGEEIGEKLIGNWKNQDSKINGSFEFTLLSKTKLRGFYFLNGKKRMWNGKKLD